MNKKNKIKTEKKYPLALVIARFQPFSENHDQLLREIVKKFNPEKLLLGIGTSGKIDGRYFLNFEEIKEIITPILENLGVEYEIKEIPDINNPPKYGSYVETFFPEMNEDTVQIFTDNTYTSDCFTKYGHNYKIVLPIIPSKIRATEVRDLIKNNGDWESFVPKNVAEYLKKNDCLKRFK